MACNVLVGWQYAVVGHCGYPALYKNVTDYSVAGDGSVTVRIVRPVFPVCFDCPVNSLIFWKMSTAKYHITVLQYRLHIAGMFMFSRSLSFLLALCRRVT